MNADNRDPRHKPRIGLWRLLLIGVLVVPILWGAHYAVHVQNADTALRTGLGFLQSNHSRKHENAVLWLKRAVERDPANKTARYYLAAAYREMGAQGQAIEAYEGLLARDPHFIQARFHLGTLRLARHEFAQAAEQFAAHIGTNNMFWQSYYGLGYCYSELKRPKEAIAAFAEIDAIHRIQNLPAEKYLEVKKLLYLTYREAGDTQGALRTLETINKLQPPAADALADPPHGGVLSGRR